RTLSNVITAVNYQLDANGNLTSDGLRTFNYGADNRLETIQITKDGEAAKITQLHNAAGQRVFKSEPQTAQTLPNETTLGTTFTDWLKKNFSWLYATAQTNATLGTSYTYGDGNLPSWAMTGEYGNGGANSTGRTEYIWLPTDDGSAIPVGIYRNNRYYQIHSDHLGTPRLVKDDTAKPVWQWSYSAFGDNKPTGILKATTNPNSAITNQPVLLNATNPAVVFNLRMPGQTADVETGTFQNYFRDYDPLTGRYRQSDPAGLDGGSNRFAYGLGNPIKNTDPMGLNPSAAAPGLSGSGVGGAGGAAGGLVTGPKPTPSDGDVPSSSGRDRPTDRPARPDRPSQTPSDSLCAPAEHLRLQNIVDIACSLRRSCNPTQSCPELQENLRKSRACYEARRNINNQCFNGGDLTHRREQEKALEGINICLRTLQIKQCFVNCE
ncbi:MULTISPECIES: RHS repeat-associated core domain-containing protein, partial [unclassified Microcoleus]|uniref:RHS repeat-associated core domain-containing protein n=1 Tax=unclassified Microcoleus TaxID=2642155 RepID=UPI002FD6E5F5